MMRIPQLVALATGLALAGCADDTVEPDAPAPEPPGVREVATPAEADSGRPRLSSTPDGSAILSWSEPEGDQHVLRYSVWSDSGWAAPQTADSGTDWMVNWADTPGVVELPNGQTVAHSLVHTGGHSYNVRARVSDGATWSEPVTPHTDGLQAEHGFVSVVPMGDRAGLVWLDGREQAGGHGHGGGPMTLRFATLGLDGELADEAILDTKACDCCPTSAVATPSGIVVAYRDRTEAEVRDISVVRLVDGTWTDPVPVHEDGWAINACPVNGPALAAHGDRVALAWFTGADSSRVQVALSDNGGATFGTPLQLDGGNPVGRVSAAMLPSGDAVIGWLERVEGQAEFRVRRVALAGTLDDPMTVATVTAGRQSGVPHLVAVGGRVLAAWTDPEAEVPLQSAVVTL
ncbi:MAG: hypothetical protein Rubg2KO_20600 [Rubricoccaceae bacterium]